MRLSGIIQALDTKSETEYCRIFGDTDGSVAKWVCDGLNENTDWIGNNVTIGISLGGKLIAGIIINDIRPERDCWLTIYSTDKRWCIKRVLKCVFGLIFNKMKCKRCSIFISKDNEASLRLCKKLGFTCEGLLRQYADDGQDRFVLGMLKSECIWSS